MNEVADDGRTRLASKAADAEPYVVYRRTGMFAGSVLRPLPAMLGTLGAQHQLAASFIPILWPPLNLVRVHILPVTAGG